MADQACTYQLNGIERVVEFDKTIVLSLSVLHFIFSPVAALGNALVIRALWKASSIPGNVKKLFLSLAISDLAVGLFAQLMIAVVYRRAVNENFNLLCPAFLTVHFFCSFLLACVSFLTVTAIAVDRLLAMSLHLRYRELVTSKRVIAAIVSVWLTSGVAAAVVVSPHMLTYVVTVVIGTVGFLLTTVAYIHIYRVVRYQRNEMQNQCQPPNAQAMELLKERMSAFSTLYFYIVFLACYIPSLCSTVLLIADGSRISFLVSFHITFFIVLLNSSLNPIVYCWRYREIREIVKSTVKKILRIAEA